MWQHLLTFVNEFDIKPVECCGEESSFEKIDRKVKMKTQIENLVVPRILIPVPGSSILILDKCDGTETLADANEVFVAGIDSDFKNCGTDKVGVATQDQPVTVYDLALKATYSQMFGSLTSDRNKLRLEQHQIKKFCKKYLQHLSRIGATLFLFEVDGKFFVANVYVLSYGLFVNVSPFESAYVWYAEYRHHLVVPQLETQPS